MITIDDILRPHHVALDVTASRLEEAILNVASLLRDDERVLDWPGFYDSLKTSSPCLETDSGADICIPHARTDHVSSMVMSVGRLKQGVGSGARTIRYIFVIGVPVALASDYLRIIGALARAVKRKSAERKLAAATTGDAFARILAKAEVEL